MGIGIVTKDLQFEIDDPEAGGLFQKRQRALEELAEYSAGFFDGSRSLDSVTVQGTTFARPTWITDTVDPGRVRDEARKYKNRRYHLLLGNGGSVEPAMALFKALVEPFGEAVIIPVDSSNPDDPGIVILHTNGGACKDNSTVYAVSKSGNTLNIVVQALGYINMGYQVVPITEDRPSVLREIIHRKGMPFVEHSIVGGRYTACQPNALVPVYAAALYNGVEASIDEFVAGFNFMAQLVRPDIPIAENPAKQIALLLYQAELAGFTQIFHPIYSKRLMGVAGLTTQLVHETYAKDGRGQTILAMEGPECQHHTNQRYFGGPRDMVGFTVGVGEYSDDIPADVVGLEDIDIKGIGKLGDMAGLSFGDLVKYERLGVYLTAVAEGMPIMDITLDRVDGDSVGRYIALMQGVVIYSAFLRGSTWEDQPAVEASKNRTIEMAKSRENPNYLDSSAINF